MKSSLLRIVAPILAGALALCAAAWVGAGTTGIISGVVKSADGGAPISGANVIVSGTKLSTVTDANGYYVITSVPPGDYEVRAEMVGFATQTVSGVQVTMDAKATANFEVSQEAIVEAAKVVTRSRPMINPEATNTMNQVTSVQENMTRTDASSLHGVPSLVTALPGVMLEPDGSGQIHLRGGRTDGVGYYIEGIPITDPNSGFFSTNLFSTGISKFQVYSGGFGAEYGNANSGVLNEVKKTGATAPGVHMLTEGGSQSYGSVFAEVGGGTPDTMNFYAGSVLQHNEIEGNPSLLNQNYSDNTVKVVWPKKNDTFTALALQGSLAGFTGDYHDVGLDGVPTPHEKDFLRQRYNLGMFGWNHNFNSQSFISVRPYFIYSTTIQNLMSPDLQMFVDAWSLQKGFQTTYTNQLSDRHLLKGGFELISSDNNYRIYYPPSALYDYRSDTNTFQTAFFAEDTVKLSPQWVAQAGLRREGIRYDRGGRYYDPEQEGYLGAPIPDASEGRTVPRLGISYSPNPKTAWKANWGQYTKFAAADYVHKVYTDPTSEAVISGLGSTAPQESTEYEVSYERQMSDSMSFRVTPFWADYTNLIQMFVDPDTGLMSYSSFGKGESRGVEAYVRKRMSDKWEGWLSYTYQKATANTSGDTDYLENPASSLYYTAWDQRHTVTLVTNYKAGRWLHGMRLDYGSGRADSVSPGATDQGRAKPYWFMTYNLSVQLPKDSSIGDSVNLSVFNLFDNKQVLQSYGSGADRAVSGWMPSRSVSLGVSKAF